MKPAIVITGLVELTTRVNRITSGSRPLVSDALNTAAEEVFNESQRRVPVDTGNLRGSGRVTPSKAETLQASVGYGGTAAAYALAVHETHRSQSKYLEAPARDAAKRVEELVTNAIKAAIG